MRAERALTKQVQYQRVYRLGFGVSNKFIIIKAVANSLETSRFGYSVNKPLGKAVVRNRIKRQLKEIMRRQKIRTGWDVVLIARHGVTNADFQQLNRAVENLLTRAELLIDKNEVVNTGVN